ncbi:MAG: ribose ABC transporter permease, partial [Myxococcota bacterium]|nr:ribose ABC transporter permease [Myxococcota bacterium]
MALVVMCLSLWISNPDFLGQSNAINTARQISMLGIYATGIGFVIITGGIDLSIGSVIGLTGVLIAKISSTQTGGLGHPLWMGVAVGVGVALLIGLGQGLL